MKSQPDVLGLDGIAPDYIEAEGRQKVDPRPFDSRGSAERDSHGNQPRTPPERVVVPFEVTKQEVEAEECEEGEDRVEESRARHHDCGAVHSEQPCHKEPPAT